MELIFRKLYPPKSVAPQPGEVYIVPAGERVDLAGLVCEKGAEAFLRGEGPYERIVIDADAKFDDMLAASLLERVLTGHPLAPGCQAFARYTAQVRDGLRPAKFPLENSLEGIFLAIRCHAEKHLTDPEASASFLADWSRLADVILKAAEQGTDPFTTPLLLLMMGGGDDRTLMDSINLGRPKQAIGSDFSRERRFLTDDLAVYRDDYSHGETWQAQVPGGPPSTRVLLLRQPQSLLFKHWTRSQCSSPVDGPYPFVAVTFWHGQWVFSTDPINKISLKGLADQLQAAELKKAPERAQQDPWFDGKPTNYQVVASPRAGTVLSDDDVLKLVRKWCRARPVGATDLGKYVAAVNAACIAAALTMALFFPASSGPKELMKIHDLYVLSIGVSKYVKLNSLPSAVHDAEEVQTAFKRMEGTKLCKFVETRIMSDFEATRSNILEVGLRGWLLKEKRPTKQSLVIITFSGHGLVDPDTDTYVFAPHDYDPASGITGIILSDLQHYLKRLPCPVVVIFDTCHSGAAEDEDANDPDKILKSMRKSVDDAESRYGLAVMMACGPEQKANETRRWKHGAFTLAFLEGIQGQYRHKNDKLAPIDFPAPADGGIISLKEMDRFVTDRVQQLSNEISVQKNRKQRAKTWPSHNIALEQIPIAIRVDSAKPSEPAKK